MGWKYVFRLWNVQLPPGLQAQSGHQFPSPLVLLSREKGDMNRRTASMDWSKRSSRGHGVFHVVIESQER